MCEGCWIDAGSPQIDNDLVRKLAKGSLEINPYGAFHIVVDDWNLEDGNIQFCMADDDCTESERLWATEMLTATEDERYSALALADGFWQSPLYAD